jgi:hypothetical protein
MESEGIVFAIFRPVKTILEKKIPAACARICYNKNKKEYLKSSPCSLKKRNVFEALANQHQKVYRW